MDKYVTINEMAKLWNVLVRQVQLPCQNGIIEGVSKFGNAWAIPNDMLKPTHTMQSMENPDANLMK